MYGLVGGKVSVISGEIEVSKARPLIIKESEERGLISGWRRKVTLESMRSQIVPTVSNVKEQNEVVITMRVCY